MLAIGRALMAEPKLLILDEPTAALAPKTADLVFQKLTEIRSQLGVTIMLVEQNARKALGLANRGFVLIQGKKAFEGTPEEILKDTEIIRLFLENSPSRFLTVVLSKCKVRSSLNYPVP